MMRSTNNHDVKIEKVDLRYIQCDRVVYDYTSMMMEEVMGRSLSVAIDGLNTVLEVYIVGVSIVSVSISKCCG